MALKQLMEAVSKQIAQQDHILTQFLTYAWPVLIHALNAQHLPIAQNVNQIIHFKIGNVWTNASLCLWCLTHISWTNLQILANNATSLHVNNALMPDNASNAKKAISYTQTKHTLFALLVLQIALNVNLRITNHCV